MENRLQTIVALMLPKETPGYGNNDMIRRVYSPDGIAPTIRTFGGGNQDTKNSYTTLKMKK